MSLVVYEAYAQAQHAVDYLADHSFPIQNIAIVGTELKSVERVTGRSTRGRIAAAGAVTGFWVGVFVGIAFMMFGKQNQFGFLLGTPVLGALFGLVWSQVRFAAAIRHGGSDFASVSQIVATRYEVLVEHRFAEEARGLLAPTLKGCLP
jgi:hypothetical protein